jgi:AcrR family transcriptional regulator
MGRPRGNTAGTAAPASKRKRLTDRGQATRDRILDAAEELFAEQGFVATPIRDITHLAECDLGSVSYHFANKDEIFYAVLARRAQATCTAIAAALARTVARQGDRLTVEHVLGAFAETVFRPLLVGDVGWTHYCRLVTQRLMVESNGYLHPVLADSYLPLRRQYLDTLGRILPGVPPIEIEWCFAMFESAFGSMLFGANNVSHGNRLANRAELKRLRSNLVPYSAAGFRQIALRHVAARAPRRKPVSAETQKPVLKAAKKPMRQTTQKPVRQATQKPALQVTQKPAPKAAKKPPRPAAKTAAGKH